MNAFNCKTELSFVDYSAGNGLCTLYWGVIDIYTESKKKQQEFQLENGNQRDFDSIDVGDYCMSSLLKLAKMT